MVGVPSSNASDDGPSAEAAPERGAGTKRPVSVEFGLDRPRPDRLRHGSAPAIRFTRHQIAHRRPGIHGPKNRVPEMLRLLHLLALAIATVVCAGITSPGRGIANLAAPIEVAAADSANAARCALAAEPSPQQWRDRAPRPLAEDLQAVESDSDDGDTRCELADDAAVAFRRISFPREPGRALRGEPEIDASRFAIDTGLPRGPPT
jgi:hypothetical protein